MKQSTFPLTLLNRFGFIRIFDKAEAFYFSQLGLLQ